ncbi:MAG: hypothetical protein HQL40_19210 [Alphaproteobacteria bacterium]|nr:hypothetical protein [Alphaproteobacteria bacterium]
MLARDYLDFKRALDAKGILFSISGHISEAILFSVGDALKKRMAVADTDVNTVKRVFSVFVEQVQNIIRYSAERIDGPGDNEQLSHGTVSVGLIDGRFHVACCNVIRNEEVPMLRARLEHLRALSKDDMKAYYREQLREPPASDSRGATIGLIEIARRAARPIEFGFEELDQTLTFFCLEVCI